MLEKEINKYINNTIKNAQYFAELNEWTLGENALAEDELIELVSETYH